MTPAHLSSIPTCVLTATLLATGSARGGETLYNGIELPDAWPPRRTAAELRTLEPMAVPYLKTPPAVVPIDVGRQLFVDDFLIERTTLTRRFHKAQLYAENPVLRPDKRWEKYMAPPASAMAFSDGCFYDPQDNHGNDGGNVVYVDGHVQWWDGKKYKGTEQVNPDAP